MAGLWRKSENVDGGKYLVMRRDGSIPEWPCIVLGAKDMAAPAGLRAYADAAERLGYDQKYVWDVRMLAAEFEDYMQRNGAGDPDAPPHRPDDPTVVDLMLEGSGA